MKGDIYRKNEVQMKRRPVQLQIWVWGSVSDGLQFNRDIKTLHNWTEEVKRFVIFIAAACAIFL